MSILSNEKYAGNLLLQKSYVTDHLTKKQKKNRGELPKYYVQDSHVGIIDQETFDRVQEERKLRTEQFEGNEKTPENAPTEKNPLAQKITCGLCGKHFIRRFGNTKAKYKMPLWICPTYMTRTKAACPSRRISERVLFPILAGILGVSEGDVPDECYRIDEIVVYPDGKLIVTVNGETYERHWENPSRALSWTAEMKSEAARKEAERKEAERKKALRSQQDE